MVPRFLMVDSLADGTGHVFIGCASCHQSGEIVLADRKQASANLAVRGHPNAATLPAKWVRHRRNDAYFPDAIFKNITPGSLAARVLDFAKRHELRHAL